ncbi:hypothetical protein [Helicobacter bilis]|uniref:hypothetical protein n=1 Tax=Helicobacter bilis TaxID=37372 RepID=UPI0025A9D8F6|nr:hypothetical protein [Helicobacter bilis]
MIKIQTYYINRKNKQTYYVYDVATYKSGDTDLTCVIYALYNIRNKGNKEYYVRSIDDFKANFYKKRKSRNIFKVFKERLRETMQVEARLDELKATK